MTGTAEDNGRLGLRSRVTVAFALGALVLSAGLALITYELARAYLVRQREASVLRQAYVNARLVRAGLRAPSPDLPEILSSLEAPRDSSPVVLHKGNWFAASLAVGPDALPPALREMVVDEGRPARQNFRLDAVPRLAVGVPIPAVDAAYFETFSLETLERTLEILRSSLAAAAVVTTLVGVGIGRWASSLVLQPVAAAARAAAEVADGHLDVRVETGADPDLATLADSFNQMTDALRHRLERDARFASAVSHELRSPLMTLTASVEVLSARRAELGPRAVAALDLLESDLGRFRRLVEDLLEISRIDVGAGQLVAEDVRLVELLRQAVAHSGREGLPVEAGPGAEDLVVRVEKRRLERVVTNLLDNADTHGEGALRICVEGSPEGACFAVEDAGPGVDADEREHIFERFARGRSAGRRGSDEGTGLGLSLVAEHVRLHDGRVWVEERQGGGARFVVELPAAPPGTPPDPG